MSDQAWQKLSLLAEGVQITDAFIQAFAEREGAVRRRNFYNSPGLPSKAVVPQEIVLDGDPPVIVAVNQYPTSAWVLDWSAEGPNLRSGRGDRRWPVSLIDDLDSLREDPETRRTCNLYGGTALAYFSPRACYFFADDTQCTFCSLAGTASEHKEYAGRVTPQQLTESLEAVLEREAARLTQIMIVGGNERNLDRGFAHQAELLCVADQVLTRHGLQQQISTHLITMPPHDLQLLDLVRGLANAHVGFNLEVWGRSRFDEVAPGKAKDYGRDELLNALLRLGEVVGPYRAHSILIAGLEPTRDTLEGAKTLASEGVSPIINLYHSDRHSKLGLTLRPAYDQLADVAEGLQAVHDTYPVQAYWQGCGRNSIDHEAAIGMFRNRPASPIS